MTKTKPNYPTKVNTVVEIKQIGGSRYIILPRIIIQFLEADVSDILNISYNLKNKSVVLRK